MPWELAAGTHPHWMATLLDLAALATGPLLAPRATWEVFVRGRVPHPLRQTAGGLDPRPSGRSHPSAPRARCGGACADPRDRAAFVAWSATSSVALVATFVLAPLLILVGLLLQ